MSTKQKRIFWPTLMVILATPGFWGLLAARTLAGSTPSKLNSYGAGLNVFGGRNHIDNNERVEALPIILRPIGFVPREITRPKGYFYFSVQNASGEREILLRLDRANGGRLHEVSVKKMKPYWRQGVRLPPGRYLLTEANHPDWVCHITITPQ